MARSKKGSASRTLPIALELLAADHRKVEGLFARFEKGSDGDDPARRALAHRICAELKAHMQLEEELFYPWLRENLDEDSMRLIEEAYAEHASARNLIAQLESEGEMDEAYETKMKALSEAIEHHVKEEESEIFTKVLERRDELDELGQEMHARRAGLMEELGLREEGGEMSAMGMSHAGRSARTRQQSARRGSH